MRLGRVVAANCMVTAKRPDAPSGTMRREGGGGEVGDG